ncbi:MAG: addiction module antidote protein family [Phycisphaerales bacterium]|nr:addiction module antidote protein family [Phycisphaerales bacterium]
MATRTTVNVSLTPHLQQVLNEQVASGRYGSASEVVREGLRLIEERDRRLATEALRAQVDLGWQQSELGQGRDGEAAFAEARKRLRAKLAGPGAAAGGKASAAVARRPAARRKRP